MNTLPSISHTSDTSTSMNTITSILTMSSKHKYQELHNTLKVEHPSLLDQLPSWYKMVVSRPNILTFILDKPQDEWGCNLGRLEINDTKGDLTKNDVHEKLKKDNDPPCTQICYGAKLDGGYKNSVDNLVGKFVKMKIFPCEEESRKCLRIGFIDSFDGAQHVCTEDVLTNVTSYNTLMFS